MAHEDNIPAGARVHHARLQELGVVDRVSRTLVARDVTYGISDLVCWVTTDRGELVVKAAYMHQRAGVTSGKPAGSPVGDRASFRVAEGKPFGPMRSEPLPAEVVTAVRDMARSS